MASFPIAANARGALQLARETVESWRAPREEIVWEAGEQESVLLLHGLGGTPRMLHPMRNYLRRELARPAFDLALGVGLGDIRDLAIRVHDELTRQQVRNCDLIGYSMGGLVAAYLVKCLDHGRCIRRVVTLGTPHRGVPVLTQWRGLLARWWRATDQMRTGSPFLEQLLRIPPPDGTAILSIAGGDDTIVPPPYANLEGAGYRNLVVPGLDHWTLPTSRRVFRCVKEVLQAGSGRWPTPHLETVEPSPSRARRAAPRPISLVRSAARLGR
ncbi:MAG: alpha/beta fold hydrolase [Deltaproteobacteria bacterium]|nr:MAG: alpha/beta fold hydrolase [Deltaproteobacteria bacterium]